MIKESKDMKEGEYFSQSAHPGFDALAVTLLRGFVQNSDKIPEAQRSAVLWALLHDPATKDSRAVFMILGGRGVDKWVGTFESQIPTPP